MSQPTYIHFSHQFGRKPLVISCLIFFLVGTSIGAAAQTSSVLIAARVLMGIGSGGLVGLPEVIITDIVPLRVRGMWLSVVNGAYAGGCLLGPVLGGIFVEKTSWRWTMLFNIPILLVALVIVVPFLHLPNRSSILSVGCRLKRIDWGGIILFTLSITLSTLPLTWSGVIFDWISWQTIETFVIGSIGLAFFAYYEGWIVVVSPLIPGKVFRNRTIVITYIQAFIMGAVAYSEIYFIPLWSQATRGFCPLLSGVSVLPYAGLLDMVAVIVGIMISHFGRYRWANYVGFSLQALGLATLTIFGRDIAATPANWVCPLAIAGLGTGFLFASLRLALQSAASNEETADAVSVYIFIRDLGLTLGVAISGTIFQNQIRQTLADIPMLKDQAAQLSRDTAALIPIIGTMENHIEQHAVKDAYGEAFQTVNIVMCALSIVGLVLCPWVESYSMDRDLADPATTRREKSKAAAYESTKTLIAAPREARSRSSSPGPLDAPRIFVSSQANQAVDNRPWTWFGDSSRVHAGSKILTLQIPPKRATMFV